METPRFVHLHLHTDYSLLDGACDLEEVVDEAARRQMPARSPSPITATCSRRSRSTTPPRRAASNRSSVAKCMSPRAAGTTAGNPLERESGNGHSNSPAEPGQRGANHLVLLCENAEGYRNLIKLVSAGYLEGFYYKPKNRLRPARQTQQRADRIVGVFARRRHRKSGGRTPGAGA